MKYEQIVQEVINGYKDSPIDILGIGDGPGEFNYMNGLIESYARTVRDVDSLFKGERGTRRVLEIGSFLGPVSISLKKLGFEVFSQDIPEFSESAKLKSLYEKHGIPFIGANLRAGRLPYETASFDVVIACEVIEHLNFNPLPVLDEINRVLKEKSFLYIGMPNQASIFNRVKMLKGRSIHNAMDDYFKQLDRTSNMIVGLHWREYTMDETVEIFKKMGFDVVEKYFYQPKEGRRSDPIRRLLKELVFSYPPFRGFQVVIGRKTSSPKHDFWRTEANS